MIIVTILLGLVGLGVVVIVHELGHYAAARATGVEVEAFSIGWGPRIASFKRGRTEWRISALPLGGYCRMKGEESFQKALQDKAPELPREPGSFYGASPWRRIIIAISGPLANVLLAVLVFMLVSTIAYSVPTYSNKIVLLSEYDLGSPRLSSYPADKAGLKTGDRVVAIDGKPIADFSDLAQSVTLSADKPIQVRIERNGITLDKVVTPLLDKDTGAGLMGVTYWADPIIGELGPGSAARIAGLEPGDRVVSLDGVPVSHAIEVISALNSKKPERLVLGIERGGARQDLTVVLSWNAQGKSNLGLSFKTETHEVRAASTFPAAVRSGFAETWNTFDATLVGLGSLFKGVNLLKALSGPARITYMVGQSATEGIQSAGQGGLAVPLNFLAFLSVGLFIMNLLPIPALDGGQIVMFVVEAARRKGLKPLTIYRYQLVGATFILAIFVIATVGDLLFFTAK